MRIGQVYEYPVDQVITRQDYASLEGLSQVTALTKDQITRVQKELLRLGYPIGTADGVVGAKTATAVRQVQTKVKLVVSGTPDSKLLKLLDSGDQKLLAATDADKKAVSAATATVTVPTVASKPAPAIATATTLSAKTVYKLGESDASRNDPAKAITYAQGILKEYGYPVDVNGSYDDKTARAFQMFRTKDQNFLKVTQNAIATIGADGGTVSVSASLDNVAKGVAADAFRTKMRGDGPSAEFTRNAMRATPDDASYVATGKPTDKTNAVLALAAQGTATPTKPGEAAATGLAAMLKNPYVLGGAALAAGAWWFWFRKSKR